MPRRALALALLALVALLGAAAPAGAAKPRKAAKATTGCFKKTTTAKSGRKVRRKVCRARRKTVVKRPAAALPAPLPAAAPAPLPAPVPVAPAPAAPADGGSGDSGREPDPVREWCQAESSTWLTVTAYDRDQVFLLRFSRTCLRAGRTTVQYVNDDAQPHNLKVEGVSPARPEQAVVGDVEGGQMGEADVDLTAGTWRFFCDIEGHESMTRTLEVTPG